MLKGVKEKEFIMSISKNNLPEVRVSYDNMEAFIKLPIPQEGTEYTLRELVQLLDSKGVKAGIDQEMLLKIINDKLYMKEKRVAVGKEPVEGRDGYYEFLFNRDFNHAPKELPDGSVDYHAINLIATVSEGDTIAIYHESVQGKNGYNVKGAQLAAKRKKDLVPLRGKGFTRSEDGKSYYADLDGKIDFVNERLVISPLYEIASDVDMQTTGDICFNGDVTIHGAVRNGMMIRATGTVTVDGIVENSCIDAGKDIVLKSGFMGKSGAVIRTKADLYAKFIEYATLDVRGTINAEALLGCDVVCGERLVMSGKQGRIVGGMVRAIGGAVANQIGNQAEVKTEICVGVESDIYRRYKILEHKIATAKHQIEMIDQKVKEIELEDAPKTVMDKPKSDPRKVSLLRTKIHENAVLQENQLELEELEGIINRAEGADVMVSGIVYPGSVIQIDELKHEVKDEQHAVQFVKFMDKIRMESIY